VYAQRRVTATVDDYMNNGATAKDVDVSGRSATLLTGGVGSGYDVPLLVVASGQRTIAVNLAESFGDEQTRTTAMTALAKVAIIKTGG
jgi:hypothetical protein